MEKFEVYNRQLNKWDSENISIVPGWSENWVLDKTTDTMSLKLKYKSIIAPNFNVGDWCRILHAETPSYERVLVKENEFVYKPLNYEQYIIGDITLVENKIAGEWDCQLKLKEPIEITSGILCETMSFTNQISKTVDGVVYTHEPLNHLSVLEKILKVTPANNDLQKSWWSRIKICNQAFLENIAFNDETYSEPSLYNILIDKYDSSVGRTPVLYFDINPETDLPNDLSRETYILDFERQDGFNKESINYSDLIAEHNEIIINKSDENFTDGLISNYDNLSPNNVSTYVSENLWAVPEINNNDRELSKYGIDSEKGIWVLKTPHTIKKVNSIKRLTIKQYEQSFDGIAYIERKNEDLTNLILEQKQYLASDKYDTRDVIWFEEGSNIIHLNDYYYNSYAELGLTEEIGHIYRVEYEPFVSGRYDLGKDYQTQINQNDSQIDSQKFGDYLKNYFASMNKADIIIQKTVDNFGDIKEVGTRVINNDKNYIITNVAIQNRGYDYEVIYQLNENHIRRNDLIVAPQEIRKDIAIGVDATKERKSMLNFDFNISLNNINNLNILNNDIKDSVYSSLLSNVDVDFIEIAKLNIFSNLSSLNGIIENKIDRLCEIARYNINNSFCLNIKYNDNAEAGKQKELKETNGFDIENLTTPKIYNMGSVIRQIPILYTDYFGEFETFNLSFININAEELTDIKVYAGVIGGDVEFDKTNNAISPLVNYPTTDGLENIEIINIIEINNINYYKDMLDTFNYTIAFTVNSDVNIILCKSFFLNSLLLTKNGAKISTIKTYNQNITENDYKVTDFISVAEVISILEEDGILITLNNELNVSKSVVLVDTENNPILIINDFDKTQFNDTFKTLKLYC